MYIEWSQSKLSSVAIKTWSWLRRWTSSECWMKCDEELDQKMRASGTGIWNIFSRFFEKSMFFWIIVAVSALLWSIFTRFTSSWKFGKSEVFKNGAQLPFFKQLVIVKDGIEWRDLWFSLLRNAGSIIFKFSPCFKTPAFAKKRKKTQNTFCIKLCICLYSINESGTIVKVLRERILSIWKSLAESETYPKILKKPRRVFNNFEKALKDASR